MITKRDTCFSQKDSESFSFHFLQNGTFRSTRATFLTGDSAERNSPETQSTQDDEGVNLALFSQLRLIESASVLAAAGRHVLSFYILYILIGTYLLQE